MYPGELPLVATIPALILVDVIVDDAGVMLVQVCNPTFALDELVASKFTFKLLVVIASFADDV
jgi:hypothetical protein